MKKYKILIIIFVLIIAVGVWYFSKNIGDNGEKEITFATGFTLLDDEESLVLSEQVNLDPQTRAAFEKKVEEIKTDLIIAEDRDQRLADFNNLAIYEKYLGNYSESYDAYLESLKIENLARVTWQNFADVLLEMQALKSAEMAYLKSVELNKYIPESYVKLANYYKTVRDDEKVEATYKLAIETIKVSSESDTLVLNAYADWLAKQKRNNEAIEIYEQLIVKQPSNKASLERKIMKLRE